MIDVGIGIGHLGGTGARPPASSGGNREDLISAKTAAALAEFISCGGRSVAIMGYGTYKERRAWAARNCWVYIDLHVNAFEGNPEDNEYGLVLHDKNDTRLSAVALADSIAEELEQAWIGVLSDVKVRGAVSTDWTKGAHFLIKGLKDSSCVGIVLEPGFINQKLHRGMWTEGGIRHTANAVGLAILGWLQ